MKFMFVAFIILVSVSLLINDVDAGKKKKKVKGKCKNTKVEALGCMKDEMTYNKGSILAGCVDSDACNPCYVFTCLESGKWNHTITECAYCEANGLRYAIGNTKNETLTPPGPCYHHVCKPSATWSGNGTWRTDIGIPCSSEGSVMQTMLSMLAESGGYSTVGYSY